MRAGVSALAGVSVLVTGYLFVYWWTHGPTLRGLIGVLSSGVGVVGMLYARSMIDPEGDEGGGFG